MASLSSSHYPKPRKVSVLSNYEKTVRSAFKCDCESFLEQFEKNNTLNYAYFANIWQKNNFTFIYADQSYASTLKVLCEVCFMTVKKYFKFQKSLYIKVGALYLLYGLYYKQPIQHMVKIRLTLEEYRSIKNVMDEMLHRGQYDILYIFAKMKSDNVFLYTAKPMPLNIELTKSVKNMTHVDDTFQHRGTESSLNKFKEVLGDETVQALQKTSSEYDALLKKYADKHHSLRQFKSTITEDFKQAYSKVFGEVSTESQASQSECAQMRTTRESIRLRALQNKTAEYRGSKQVLTAIDIDDEDDEFVELPPRRNPKRRSGRGRPRGARSRNSGKKSSKKSSTSKDDSGDSD